MSATAGAAARRRGIGSWAEGRRSEAAALAAVRAVLRGRRNRASGEDAAYRVYLVIMLTIIVIAPVVRAIVLWVADGVPGRPGAAAVAAFGAALALVAVLAALAGAQTGPARASLPALDLLLSSALPRTRLLRRTIRAGFVWAALAGLLLGGIIVTGRALAAGGVDPWLAVGVCCAMVGAALLAAAAMLFAQLGRAQRWWIAGGIAVVAALGLLAQFGLLGAPVHFEPWSVAAALALAPAGPTVAAAEVPAAPDPLGLGLTAQWFPMAGQLALFVGMYPLVAGLAAAVGAASYAEQLRFDALREQALRWDAVSALAFTGDPRGATARLGAPVSTGRHWRLRLPAAPDVSGARARLVSALVPGVAIAARDLHGLRRTPARSLAALLGLAGTGVLLGLVFPAAGSAPGIALGGIAGAGAALLAYASIGPWCRGLRAAAEGVGASPLLPFAPGRLLAWHLLVPAVLTLLVLGGTAALAGGPVGFAAGIVTALVALLLRLGGALKGTIPQRLLAPVPTPAGDMSAVNVFVWTIDGLIAAVFVGGVLGALCAAVLAALVPLAVLLVAMALALLGLTVSAVARLSGARG